MYLNFGVTFSKRKTRFYPKEYECVVFGRNPIGLRKKGYIKYQASLDDWDSVLKVEREKQKLIGIIQAQVLKMIELSDISFLKKEVYNGRLQYMIVKRRSLSLEP